MTSATIDDVKGQATASENRYRIYLILFAVAHLPFVILFFINIWKYRPHYEFAPILTGVAGYLIWTRWPRETCEMTPFCRKMSVVLLLAGMASLTAAVLLFSPTIGIAAAVLNLGGLILMMTGRNGLKSLFSAWILLLLIVPPPRNLDNELISLQQTLTSEVSHRVLNVFEVLHKKSGNIFEIPDRQLFVAEACSGVNSQLVLLAAGSMLCVYERRNLLHSMLLIGSAFCWSVLANTSRVTFVVLALDKWGMDLVDGWPHDALGFLLILFGFIGLLSTDQLLIAILGPLPVIQIETRGIDASMKRSIGIDNFVYRIWNRFVARRDTPIPRHAPPPDPELDSTPSKHFVPAGTRGLQAVTIVALLLGSTQLACSMYDAGGFQFDLAVFGTQFGEDSMPQAVGDWEVADYRTIERDRSSQEGEFTHQWSFTNGGQVTNVSMDYPFVGYHYLPGCYEKTGWRLTRGGASIEKAGDKDYFEYSMSLPNGKYGFLLFALHATDGSTVLPDSFNRRWVRTPIWSLLGLGNRVDSTDTTVQFQVFYTSDEPLNDEQREQMRAFFKDAWQAWQTKLMAGLGRRTDG